MKLKLKTDGLTGENLEFVNKLNALFADMPEAITPEQLDAAIKSVKPEGMVTTDAMKTEIDALKAILKTQGETITSLETNGGPKKDMTLRGQIKAWLEREDVKGAVTAIKNNTQASIPEFVLDMKAMSEAMKAPATMTFAEVNVGGSAFIPAPEVNTSVIDLVRRQPTFWDLIPKGRTSRPTYVWVNKVNKDGPAYTAMFIGEGVLKPLASFELATETSVAKKIAERMKASTEILEDIEGFATLMENELAYEVKMALNAAVLNGTLSSSMIAGITTVSSAYTLTGVEVSNPNNFDAIRAAVAQLRNLNFNGPVVVVMNPIDVVNMELTKTTEGAYVLPPFTSSDGTRVSGVRIVEDYSIAQGNILVADLSKFKVLIYKDFSIAWGWENDDFSKNLVTVIGEMRIHSFHSTNHAGAFLYDSLADIKAAIDSGS